MKKNAFIIFLTFYFFSTALLAQKTITRIDITDKKKITGLRAGFFLDNGIHPGLKFGTSYLFGEKEKSKPRRLKYFQKKYGNKIKHLQYFADGNIGFYNHPNHHTGLFLGIGMTRQRTKTRITRKDKEKLKTRSWSLEVNYLRRFYNIETLELDENGTIQSVPNAGSNSLMFAISPAFGRIYGTKNGGKGFHLYLKPSLQILKYNHAFFPNAALEIGVNLNIF